MSDHTPILLLGAGRLGGALLGGWRLTGAIAPADVMIRDPQPGEAALAAAAGGAALNPPEAELAAARTVLLAVKPQVWREAAQALAPHLGAEAVIVSVAAGVRAGDISTAFGGRAAARVMPITAIAVGKGAGAVYSADARARAAAHALFDPVGVLADVEDESLMDAVTAVCGSAPAYLYAFTEALEAAGE
ncbi:MAG TPA: NAD(P)-binding domain-containing protein, partial [Caulobacteraceae bacterium]